MKVNMIIWFGFLVRVYRFNEYKLFNHKSITNPKTLKKP